MESDKEACALTNYNSEDNLSEYLQQLVAEACSHPANTCQRRQILTKVYRAVTNSGKLWRENTPYYNDALQVTWEYFCRNPERYDPTAGSLITWLSRYLRWRLVDFGKGEAQSKATKAFPRRSKNEETNDLIDPVDELPAPPDISPLLELEKEIHNWVQTDETGELRKTIFRGRSEINAQVLIQRRLPPEISWDEIAEEFKLKQGSPEAKDLPKFYHRKCLPLLQKFGSKQGYIGTEA